MSVLHGKNVLITGGASGIGKIMGRKALEQGAKSLIIWDINHELLKVTEAEFKSSGYDLHCSVIDLQNVDDIVRGVEQLKNKDIDVDILINNAGIIVGKKFWEHSFKEIKQTIAINTTALMYVTNLLLPTMISRGSGHIVNISSAASLVSNPNMSVYCASKWAVTGWSDSLRLELERENTGVKVTTVTPFYINTGMFDGVRSPILPILDPEKSADKIIKAIKRNKVFLRMPFILRFVPLLKGLFPTRVFDFLADLIGIYKGMDHFKGRK